MYNLTVSKTILPWSIYFSGISVQNSVHDVMARPTHSDPYLEATRTRNQTTIWSGLIVNADVKIMRKSQLMPSDNDNTAV